MKSTRKFLSKFGQEARGIAETIESFLSNLEHPKTMDSSISEIYRKVHTLKGTAKLLGLSMIPNFAHEIESLLDIINNKPLLLNKEVNDALLNITLLFQNGLDDLLAENELAEKNMETLMNNIHSCRELIEEANVAEQSTTETSKSAPDILTVTHDTETYNRYFSNFIKSFQIPLERIEVFVESVEEFLIIQSHMRNFLQSQKLFLENLESMFQQIQKIISNKLINDQNFHELSYKRIQEITDKRRDYYQDLIYLQFDVESATSQLSEEFFELRTAKLKDLFAIFPNHVKRLGFENGKHVQLDLKIDDFKTDIKIIEQLQSSFIHLINNAIIHGLESPEERRQAGKKTCGTIQIEARTYGSGMIIEISDDGRGLDYERIYQLALLKKKLIKDERDIQNFPLLHDFIFEKGFSTSQNTTENSGRGLGLNIVKRSVENLSGSVNVSSFPGKGTTFQLSFPTSILLAAVFPIIVGPYRLLQNVRDVSEVIELNFNDIIWIDGNRYLYYQEEFIPVHTYKELFDIEDTSDLKDTINGLVLKYANKSKIFIPDAITEKLDIVIKPIMGVSDALEYLSGATIMPDGHVCGVINSLFLFRKTDSKSKLRHRVNSQPLMNVSHRKKLLLVESSSNTSDAIVSILRAEDHVVNIATTAKDAIKILEKNKYDAIIIGLKIIDSNYLDMIKGIQNQKINMKTPIIAFINNPDKNDEDKLKKLGVHTWLSARVFRKQLFLELVNDLIYTTKDV